MDAPIPIQAVERVSADAVHIDGTPLNQNLPIDYRDRFQALVLKPDFSSTIFAHIANGGTLITLAETWGVRHSDISGYLGKHPELMQDYTAAMMARDEWERERCLQELRSIATVDIRQAYNEDGTLKRITEMPADVAAALSNVECDELFEGVGAERELIGYTRKVKFWDKAKAIELFMKKHGLLIERKQVQLVTRLEDLIGAANSEILDAEIVQPVENLGETPGPGGVPGVLKRENPSA